MGFAIILKTAKGRFEHRAEKDFVTLGRSKENDVPIDDLSVSRKHAVVEREGDRFFITDLNSSNGTFVNSKRITQKTLITMEDVVIIGRVHFSYRIDEEDEGTVRMSREEMAAAQESPNATNPVGAPPVTAAPTPPPPPVQPAASSTPPQPAAAPTPPPPPQPSAVPTPPPPPQPAAATPPPPVQPRPRAPQSYGPAAHGGAEAGFWIRFLAYIIDAVIIGVPLAIVNTLVMAVVMRSVSSYTVISAISILMTLVVTALAIAYLVVGWWKFGTTIGKRILGLYVIDAATGRAPTLGKAVLRMVGYMVNSLTLYIGFLLIAFTDGKKGLHDMIAGTRVVRR